MSQSKTAGLILRYWQASLAWKNIGEWAKGWTQESFMEEVKIICHDNGRVGYLADNLLDDVVHNKEHKPLGITDNVYPIQARPESLVIEL